MVQAAALLRAAHTYHRRACRLDALRAATKPCQGKPVSALPRALASLSHTWHTATSARACAGLERGWRPAASPCPCPVLSCGTPPLSLPHLAEPGGLAVVHEAGRPRVLRAQLHALVVRLGVQQAGAAAGNLRSMQVCPWCSNRMGRAAAQVMMAVHTA